MKKVFSLVCLVALTLSLHAVNFRFALLTDIHISPSNPSPLEDLRRSIDDIKSLDSIDFVLISGDITEAGDRYCMELCKEQFKRLNVPYFVTSGNHETTWSESGCTDFDKVFGSSRFCFTHRGICFVGFNTGPILKMADGHVSPQDVSWMREQLNLCKPGTPVIAITHYPLQEGDVDNWYDATDLLRKYNTQCIIGGHYHRNLLYNCDGIPDVLCRSNLRDKKPVNGYTIISVGPDSIRFAEKVINDSPVQWLALPMGQMNYGEPNPDIRPSYAVNEEFPKVKELWRVPIGVGIYAAPARHDDNVFVGDDYGVLHCLNFTTGQERWRFQTDSRINCTPAIHESRVMFGSTDGNIYCLDEMTGKRLWTFPTEKAVMGCPVIANVQMKKALLIGGSDGCFRAIDIRTGREIWKFDQLKGYCVSRPCVYNNKVYFGAWDCYFYALNLQDGILAWKWSNGRPSDKFSPAAVWPVASNGKIFIVAPDRVFTCLNAETGEVVYRTSQHVVRENIGISEDGSMVYSRCMWDSVQAMDARTNEPKTLWKINAGYGYDHDPSMMLCKEGVIIFGTKNGLMYGIAGREMIWHHKIVPGGTILWKHKIGNCVVNTICPINARECLITSSDGNVIRLKAK